MQTLGSRHSGCSAAPLAALAAALLLGVACGSSILRAEETDAHALAQKFADEAATSPVATAPDDASAHRRREAEARQEAAQKAATEAKRKSAEAKRRADAARRASQQARIDEQDMLTRARAEAAERAAEERALQAEIERRDAERAAIAAELETQELDINRTPADRETDAERLIEAAKAADAARKAMEDARAEESRRLAEKLKLAQERRAAQAAARAAVQQPAPPVGEIAAPPAQAPVVASPSPATGPVAMAPPLSQPVVGETVAPKPADAAVPLPAQVGAAPSPAQPIAPVAPVIVPPASPAVVAGAPPPSTEAVVRPSAPETRVTVLLLMQPGDRGIRRANKTADPVLCLGPDCYVSKGPDNDAKHVNRWQALGTFNTLGGRAGACNHSLGCVFRNVDLGAVRAMLQPIDLKIMHHDRRETREVRADPTCDMVGPRLTCAAGIKASDYRLWIVPESVARKAGAAALEAAVKAGLPEGGRV